MAGRAAPPRPEPTGRGSGQRAAIPLRRRYTGAVLPFLFLATALAAAPTLDPGTQSLLDAGEIVMLSPSATATARAAVEIDASPGRVWQVISDPVHLRASTRSVKTLTVHSDQTGADGVREQKLGYVLKVGLGEVRYNVIRRYDLARNRMTWTLDTTRENDIAATEGLWTLHPTGDGDTLFLYEARLDSGRAIPAFIQDELTEQSLKRFLSYVQQVAPQ